MFLLRPLAPLVVPLKSPTQGVQVRRRCCVLTCCLRAQYILDAGLADTSDAVLTQLTGHFGDLSCQKFSSNVVEKCLKLDHRSLDPWRAIIVTELTNYHDLPALLKDQFGNYVVQSALRVASPDLHADLVAAIRPHLAALRNLPHGKRILAQLQVKG